MKCFKHHFKNQESPADNITLPHSLVTVFVGGIEPMHKYKVGLLHGIGQIEGFLFSFRYAVKQENAS